MIMQVGPTQLPFRFDLYRMPRISSEKHGTLKKSFNTVELQQKQLGLSPPLWGIPVVESSSLACDQ